MFRLVLLWRAWRAPAPARAAARLHTGASELTRFFDSQKYFNTFKQGYFGQTGLFRNEQLTSPEGLVSFSKQSLARAQSLVADMISGAKSSHRGKVEYIRKLDQLSDILCRVIDVAEFIRVVHPNQKWVQAAQSTHEVMFEYMNQLNTNVDLYQNLADILDLDVVRELSDEEVQVGNYLRQDFERSGIAMDPEARANFVAFTQEISILGLNFNNDIHGLESQWCPISEHELEQLSQGLQAEIRAVQNKAPSKEVAVPLSGHIPYLILCSCSSESVRRKVWLALHNAPKGQIETLNDFLKYRAVLAKMLGYRSFAHYQLEHKMAKEPNNVVTFLKKLQASLLTREHGVMDELRGLYAFKPGSLASASNQTVLDGVKPWDRDFLQTRQSQSVIVPPPKGFEHENVSNYFSVGTIMSGLSELFERIYNVSLVPEATSKGETWDQNQVRKLRVVDHSANETLGYLYVDFWSPHVMPSHFTIVCSRGLNTEIGSELRKEMELLVHLGEHDYQLPVVSLICNFSKPKGLFGASDTPTLLSLDQVDTIFHEMGHAMHSMIGRTKLHNLSGTRCLTDFVELPSVLMELFSSDPRVMCRIAKHYRTEEPLSKEFFKYVSSQRNSLKHSETFMQLKMALLDQILHNEDIAGLSSDRKAFEAYDATNVYHNLESQLGVFSDQWSTWLGKFPHLFSYGAVYYSYLLDRAIAEKVYNGLFEKDPWSRDAGQKYRESILEWGGTRDPWLCLAEALDDPRLARGDSKAMEIIGHL